MPEEVIYQHDMRYTLQWLTEPDPHFWLPQTMLMPLSGNTPVNQNHQIYY
jgi:hypothetical protein